MLITTLGWYLHHDKLKHRNIETGGMKRAMSLGILRLVAILGIVGLSACTNPHENLFLDNMFPLAVGALDDCMEGRDGNKAAWRQPLGDGPFMDLSRTFVARSYR